MEKIHLSHYPLVSICIPAHNAGKYIKDTINSVLAQTYKNIEIIIVDDNSTDETNALIQSFGTLNISLIFQGSGGAAGARNNAFNHSKGQYIKFLDGDDLIDPEMIENQINLALQNEQCVISAKWGRFYDDDLRTFQLSPENCWRTLPAVEWICSSWENGSSMMQAGLFLIPRKIIEQVGLWNSALTLIDDLEFFTKVILGAEMVVFDENSTLYYRSGNVSRLSNRRTKEAVHSSFLAIEMATRKLLALDSTTKSRLACANVWQHFIYDNYPRYPELRVAAQSRIDEYGGSSLQYMCGGMTKAMVSLIGWKITCRIKEWLK